MGPTFLDPELTSEGKPYKPERYKQIVKERYAIARNANITYQDTGEMTPTERRLILQFLVEEQEQQKELIEKSKQQHNSKR